MKFIRFIKILFTKKGFNKNKKSQYFFNQIFKPYTKKEVKQKLKELK